MATITVIIKSNASQVTDVLIKDLGVTIPSGGLNPVTFSTTEEVRRLAESNDLAAFLVDDAHGVSSSTLILNDGTSDIAQADALFFLQARALPEGGDNFGVLRADSAGVFQAGTSRITGVATPTAGTDAANKDYVDGLTGTSKSKLQFGETKAVPAQGTLYLAGPGPVLTSAAPHVMINAGTITGASISVDTADATQGFKLSIRINGSEVALVTLAATNTKASDPALSQAYSANDELSVAVVNTEVSPGKSAFKEITAAIQIED